MAPSACTVNNPHNTLEIIYGPPSSGELLARIGWKSGDANSKSIWATFQTAQRNSMCFVSMRDSQRKSNADEWYPAERKGSNPCLEFTAHPIPSTHINTAGKRLCAPCIPSKRHFLLVIRWWIPTIRRNVKIHSKRNESRQKNVI